MYVHVFYASCRIQCTYWYTVTLLTYMYRQTYTHQVNKYQLQKLLRFLERQLHSQYQQSHHGRALLRILLTVGPTCTTPTKTSPFMGVAMVTERVAITICDSPEAGGVAGVSN